MHCGLAEEEFTFCSVHLPSWVSEVLEAGRSKASGSIFLGIDANCNVDDSDDQRGVLVNELCAVHNLQPLFQRFMDVGVAVSGERHVEEEGGLLLYKPDIC